MTPEVRAELIRHQMGLDPSRPENARLTQLVANAIRAAVASAAPRRVLENVHASLCAEVESLMGAEEGTPEGARLALWAAHVEAIEEALWGHEFKSKD